MKELEHEGNKILLPHHEQQPLCITRLPYRQGRKLTAVKVYTINSESVHLLVFNVPSLNLKQETKSLYTKFGKILRFNLMKDYKTEKFTEVYHVLYERIQSARFAKKMTDGKEFYGEILHVCYAPELETLQETRQKLMQRRFDVMRRLNVINNEEDKPNKESVNVEQNQSVTEDIQAVHESNKIFNEVTECPKPENTSKTIVKEPIKYVETSKLFMGEENTILIGKRKRKWREKDMSNLTDKSTDYKDTDNIEIVDCTNVDRETVTNINESLNYNKFGNEIVKKVPVKPVNKIKFN